MAKKFVENEYTWKYYDRKTGACTGFVTVKAESRAWSSSITGHMQMRGETPKGDSVLWRVNGRRVYPQKEFERNLKRAALRAKGKKHLELA